MLRRHYYLWQWHLSGKHGNTMVLLPCVKVSGEGSWCLIRVTSAQMSVWLTGLHSLITRGREAPNTPQWCCNSVSVRWTAHESLLKNRQRQRSSTERRRGLGTSKQNWLQSNSRVTSSKSLRETSEHGVWQPAEVSRVSTRYLKCNQRKHREKRNWQEPRSSRPVPASASVAFACCHANICHVHCIERLQTRIYCSYRSYRL